MSYVALASFTLTYALVSVRRKSLKVPFPKRKGTVGEGRGTLVEDSFTSPLDSPSLRFGKGTLRRKQRTETNA